MDGSATDVLFLAAFGRSGSTLLDRIFGRIDGFVSVGEIRQLWWRGLVEGQLCGCGEPVPDCPFWREVIRDAFGPFTADDAWRISALARKVDRVSCFSLACWPELHYPYRCHVQYTKILGDLYRSVQRVSGARVIFDSSKSVTHGLLLKAARGIRLHPVHLVRDSRAVAHSWMRNRTRPEIHWQNARMPTYGATKTSLDWMLVNTLIGVARAKFGSDMPRVRYEDLTRDPRARVLAMLESVGLPLPEGSEVPDRTFRLGIDHTVSGNPVRFAEGTIEVKADLEWKSALAPSKRRLVTALTWPLLRRYGYFCRDPESE